MSQTCASQWQQLLTDLPAAHRVLKTHFWGAGPHLAQLLTTLFDHGFRYSTCIDIGAGVHDAKGDASLALQFARTFPPPEKVFAFEPNQANPVHALAVKAAAPGVQMFTSTHLVSNRQGLLPLYFGGHANQATSNPRLLGFRGYNRSSFTRVPATTVDHIAAQHKLDVIDVLKTDTEGCEWEVLQGARRMLRDKRVRVLLVAYEDKWSDSTIHAAFPGKAVTGEWRGAKPSVDAMEAPTLKSVTRHLDRLGYESYLLGSRGKGVQFLPLSGSHWADAFELGRDPRALGLKWTWFDFVSVVTDSPEALRIRSLLLPCAT